MQYKTSLRALLQGEVFQDLNCEFQVYYCKDDVTWDDGGLLIVDSCKHQVQLSNEYYNMLVKYITIHNGKLIIEIE